MHIEYQERIASSWLGDLLGIAIIRMSRWRQEHQDHGSLTMIGAFSPSRYASGCAQNVPGKAIIWEVAPAARMALTEALTVVALSVSGYGIATQLRLAG